VSTQSRDAAAHQECTVLIPWYVNGTLREEDRDKLQTHLAACALCHGDLALERQIHGGITRQAAVEYMPAGSLNKLLSRIEGIEEGSQAAPTLAARGRSRLARQRHWPGMLAASVAVLAIAVSLLAIDRLMPPHTGQIHTVTDNAPRAPNEVIRAVFAPNVTLVELQTVLDEARLRIISGPTEAGVYSLAATSSRPVITSLALLRQHSSVRFAESTQVSAGPDRSP
jgi:anti-sigma factor RsiW